MAPRIEDDNATPRPIKPTPSFAAKHTTSRLTARKHAKYEHVVGIVTLPNEGLGRSYCNLPKMAEDTSELLTRLSQKPGVQSTLILSRHSGAIVRSTGLVSESVSQNQDSTLPSLSDDDNETFGDGTKKAGKLSAQEIARTVWSFMGAAGMLVEDMDAEDEVKLLRVRTKKAELVIVPDPKFILVVIHDTPPA